VGRPRLPSGGKQRSPPDRPEGERVLLFLHLERGAEAYQGREGFDKTLGGESGLPPGKERWEERTRPEGVLRFEKKHLPPKDFFLGEKNLPKSRREDDVLTSVGERRPCPYTSAASHFLKRI